MIICNLPFNNPDNVTYDSCGNTWIVTGDLRIVNDTIKDIVWNV